jgi:hypothetical protein
MLCHSRAQDKAALAIAPDAAVAIDCHGAELWLAGESIQLAAGSSLEFLHCELFGYDWQQPSRAVGAVQRVAHSTLHIGDCEVRTDDAIPMMQLSVSTNVLHVLGAPIRHTLQVLLVCKKATFIEPPRRCALHIGGMQRLDALSRFARASSQQPPQASVAHGRAASGLLGSTRALHVPYASFPLGDELEASVHVLNSTLLCEPVAGGAYTRDTVWQLSVTQSSRRQVLQAAPGTSQAQGTTAAAAGSAGWVAPVIACASPCLSFDAPPVRISAPKSAACLPGRVHAHCICNSAGGYPPSHMLPVRAGLCVALVLLISVLVFRWWRARRAQHLAHTTTSHDVPQSHMPPPRSSRHALLSSPLDTFSDNGKQLGSPLHDNSAFSADANARESSDAPDVIVHAKNVVKTVERVRSARLRARGVFLHQNRRLQG